SAGGHGSPDAGEAEGAGIGARPESRRRPQAGGDLSAVPPQGSGKAIRQWPGAGVRTPGVRRRALEEAVGLTAGSEQVHRRERPRLRSHSAINDRLSTPLAPADRPDLSANGPGPGPVVCAAGGPSEPGFLLLDRGGGGGGFVLLAGGGR